MLGFTDKTIVADVLSDCSPHRPLGLRMAAEKQPASLPGLRARWKFMEPSLRKSPFLKMIPILGSMGCPYSCEFCIDSLVPYQPMDLDLLSDDLRFARENFKRPVVGWHDPNFGVRFDETMEAIERTIPPDSIDFIAESSLSLLSEPRLKRLKANGFKGLLPGVESWYDMGNKAKTGAAVGMDKVVQVAEQVNLIMKYVPYVQTNFVLGLDTNKGPEPFELTKRFVELAPGAFPGYSLLTAFGQATPLNLGYQRAGRVLPFPFHFLDNHHAMNVRPLNYAWSDFYSLLVGLTEHSFSARSNMRRFMANAGWVPKALNLVRAISSEGRGRPKYYREIARMLTTDKQFRSYFEQETTELPQFFTDRVKADLGWLWEWLPPGALFHNPNMCQ